MLRLRWFRAGGGRVDRERGSEGSTERHGEVGHYVSDDHQVLNEGN